MTIRVFIENEAGAKQKHHYDERGLRLQRVETVSRAYPYHYGFVIGTKSADGDCLDCFVISDRPLHSGDIVECEVVGLLEQTEDGLTDNNVLARLVDSREGVEITDEVQRLLTDFVLNVFSHRQGTTVGVGRFLDAASAEAVIYESIQGD